MDYTITDENDFFRQFDGIISELEESSSIFHDESPKKQSIFSLARLLLTLFAISMFLSTVIFILLQILETSHTLVQIKNESKPFFAQFHRGLIEDNYDGALGELLPQRITVSLFYSPYSLASKRFRGKYYKLAQSLSAAHKKYKPHFRAVNCFIGTGQCRTIKMSKYPMLVAFSYQNFHSAYDGPLDLFYVKRWLNRLQNPFVRLSSADQLEDLSKKYDIMVVLYLPFENMDDNAKELLNFTKVVYAIVNGNPNTESILFAIVTDSKLASRLELFSRNDIVLINSSLHVLSSHYENSWTKEQLVKDVVKYTIKGKEKSIEFLNIGVQSISSVQLARKLNKSSTIMLITDNLNVENRKYLIFRDMAREYFKCHEKNILEVNSSSSNSSNECLRNMDSYSCNSNTTLRFLAIDAKVNPQLASKFGAYNMDVLMTINAEQGITKLTRGNISESSIACLIQQHHESTGNEVQTEPSWILSSNEDMSPVDSSPDSVGQLSRIDTSAEISDIMSKQINSVILVTGGIAQGSSIPSIAAFHQAMFHFSNYSHILNFVMVDVTRGNIPGYLKFDKLPKIVISSENSDSVSWTYPEELPINYPNLIRFITTRPSLKLQLIEVLKNCDTACRIRTISKLNHRIYALEQKKRVQLGAHNDHNNRIRDNSIRIRSKLVVLHLMKSLFMLY